MEEIAEDEKYLQVGDTIVSQFDQNWGGLAEYALVKSSNCARSPPTRLSPAEAAAIGSSGASAVTISHHIKPGDRVLVIGGSGGVGTFLVQLARAREASFVAAVSTQTALMTDLGVDKAIDYREEDVWTSAEFQAEGAQFDVVFDLVEKGWDRVVSEEGRARPIVKAGRQGGRFVTTVRRTESGLSSFLPPCSALPFHPLGNMKGQVFLGCCTLPKEILRRSFPKRISNMDTSANLPADNMRTRWQATPPTEGGADMRKVIARSQL